MRIIGKIKGPDDGVQVRPMKSMRLHVRAIIRDGTRAFVGSQSLRKAELDERREVGLLISNPAVTRQIMTVFETDWAESITAKELKKEEKDTTKTAQKPEEKKPEKKDETKDEKANEEKKKEEKEEKKVEA